MTVKMRQEVERKIVAALVAAALAQGYSVGVDNGGDSLELEPTTNQETILKSLFACDDERLYIYEPDSKVALGWVLLVYGNDGWDGRCAGMFLGKNIIKVKDPDRCLE